MRCTRCHYDLPPDARFCSRCGSSVSSAPGAAVAAAGGEPAPEGERRQLTVMFCDLVGSTELSGQLDAEDLSGLFRTYQQTCVRAIDSFGGYVAQYLGEGLLVYFGYPQAHEDDAARAVTAALAIVEALPEMNARLRGELASLEGDVLNVRIGIDTGPVVVGEIGGGARREQLALGETVNRASRLQGFAGPGEILVSQTTRKILGEGFELQDLGPRELRGIREPVSVSRVVRARDRSLVLEEQADSRVPLVGRERELGFLLARWREVRGATGRTALVSGEAGVGKSRLVRALRERLASEPCVWLEGRTSPYHEHSAFFPVIGLLEQGLGFAREDSPAQRFEKLEAGFAPVESLDLAEAVPLAAALLSLPVPARYRPLLLTGDVQRRRTLDVLKRWLFGMARRAPVVVTIEDLHWSDPSTLELLEEMIGASRDVAVLLLLTFRPRFSCDWAERPHVEALTLEPLSRDATREMATAVAGERSLPPEIVREVVAKTDGIPLFVEELVKNVVESGLLEKPGSAPEMGIPSTLQGSLMARLDRLGGAKGVAQLGAVIGSEFSYELLEKIAMLDPTRLQGGLAELVGAELLQQDGVLPDAVYTFRHALIRDIAYQSLLRRQRQQYHGRVAEILEKRLGAGSPVSPELVARHYEEGGIVDRALDHYRRAGEIATERSANAEAIRHLEQAIALLRDLPQGPERDREELVLLVDLGAPLQAVRGFADSETERVYARARELSESVGDAPQAARALFGLTAFYQSVGDIDTAYKIGAQFLGLAEREDDDALRLLGHMTVGNPLFWLGRHERSIEHLEQTIALYDPARHRSLAFEYGQDPGVVARIFAGLALWMLGRPDHALELHSEAVATGRRNEHPPSLAFGLAFLASIHWLRGEPERMAAVAGEGIALSEQQGFPLWLGVCTIQRGWATAFSDGPGAARERAEAGFAEIERGLASFGTAGGAQAGAPLILATLAEVQIALGRLEEAAASVNGALGISETIGASYFDAQLRCLLADIELARSPEGASARAAAERQLERARGLAREQGARSLELRAAVRLARLAAQRDADGPALKYLAQVYASFQEGFDTRDLREARALLDA
ncbi:MAG: ATP-binding protein [Myxococcota bacterium]